MKAVEAGRELDEQGLTRATNPPRSDGQRCGAQIAGMEPLRATSKDFHVKKPGLIFRTGGKDTDEVHLDVVRVWELK